MTQEKKVNKSRFFKRFFFVAMLLGSVGTALHVIRAQEEPVTPSAPDQQTVSLSSDESLSPKAISCKKILDIPESTLTPADRDAYFGECMLLPADMKLVEQFVAFVLDPSLYDNARYPGMIDISTVPDPLKNYLSSKARVKTCLRVFRSPFSTDETEQQKLFDECINLPNQPGIDFQWLSYKIQEQNFVHPQTKEVDIKRIPEPLHTYLLPHADCLAIGVPFKNNIYEGTDLGSYAPLLAASLSYNCMLLPHEHELRAQWATYQAILPRSSFIDLTQEGSGPHSLKSEQWDTISNLSTMLPDMNRVPEKLREYLRTAERSTLCKRVLYLPSVMSKESLDRQYQECLKLPARLDIVEQWMAFQQYPYYFSKDGNNKIIYEETTVEPLRSYLKNNSSLYSFYNRPRPEGASKLDEVKQLASKVKEQYETYRGYLETLKDGLLNKIPHKEKPPFESCSHVQAPAALVNLLSAGIPNYKEKSAEDIKRIFGTPCDNAHPTFSAPGTAFTSPATTVDMSGIVDIAGKPLQIKTENGDIITPETLNLTGESITFDPFKGRKTEEQKKFLGTGLSYMLTGGNISRENILITKIAIAIVTAIVPPAATVMKVANTLAKIEQKITPIVDGSVSQTEQREIFLNSIKVSKAEFEEVGHVFISLWKNRGRLQDLTSANDKSIDSALLASKNLGAIRSITSGFMIRSLDATLHKMQSTIDNILQIGLIQDKKINDAVAAELETVIRQLINMRLALLLFKEYQNDQKNLDIVMNNLDDAKLTKSLRAVNTALAFHHAVSYAAQDENFVIKMGKKIITKQVRKGINKLFKNIGQLLPEPYGSLVEVIPDVVEEVTGLISDSIKEAKEENKPAELPEPENPLVYPE